MPGFFRSSPADGWRCRGWSPEELSALLPAVQVKHQLGRPEFFYFNDGALLLEPEVEAEHPGLVPQRPEYDEAVLGPAEFLQAVHQQLPSGGGAEREYWYASGPVEQMVPPSVMARDLGELGGFDPRPPPTALGGGRSSPPTPPEVNLWIGSAGSTAAMHYDTSHNFHIVLHGTKRFVLRPPSVALAGLYPSVHPYYRQLRPGARGLGGDDSVEAVLGPGQVLYIPAYWFHEVTTVSTVPAVALNIWTRSEEFSVSEKAFALPVPMDADWGDALLRVGAASYWSMLLSAALDSVQQRRAAAAALIDRWRGGHLAQQRGSGRPEAARTPGFPGCEQIRDAPGRARSLGPARLRRLHRGAEDVGTSFRRIADVAIRTTYIVNFGEHLARMIVGAPGLPDFAPCLGATAVDTRGAHAPNDGLPSGSGQSPTT